MSDDTQDKNGTTTTIATSSHTLLADLMQTRLLPGVDPKFFERFSAQIIAEVQPRDPFDELFVCDFIDAGGRSYVCGATR
jgi:hypothetical protein